VQQPVTEAVARGLTTEDAARRLGRDGPNVLPRPRRRSGLRRFGDQLLHAFAVMLWIAAALAFVAGLPQLGVAIVAVVLLNAAFAFAQEHRADRAAERLGALLPMRVVVWRDGQRRDVDASEVVVDDLLVLEAGDRVPADAVVTEAHGLSVDTSLLTGESEPSTVGAGGQLFAGCFVVEGEGEALVTATGASTRLAEIARLSTADAAPPTPLASELRRVVHTIALVAVAVGVGFFATLLALGEAPSEGFLFAIGLTVALVPEALLPTVTLSLAWGAEQMARRQVLVRNLEAVETLGSTTFICTDKTGTLTLNQMTVVRAWTPSTEVAVGAPGYAPVASVELSEPAGRPAVERLALAAVRCSSGCLIRREGAWEPHGDPTEVALDVFARRLGIDTDDDRRTHRPTARFPFDPRRRRMSVLVDDEIVVKGAPDAVLPLCRDARDAHEVVHVLADQGLRVLAVAGRRAGGRRPASAAEAETDLALFGLVGLEDPPRPDVSGSIAACRRAGIGLAMVTGDHPSTAAAIATEVGLRRPDQPVLRGDELPEDDDALGALLDQDGIVVARVTPEAKLRIARALRARGHVVAMTGDGVNDAPALHEADIGIAMGRSGTDVAREAADLVLLDDHFASIVAGVEHGRATYLNIRRFLTYHLTDNVAEVTPFLVWALSAGRIPLALGVLQILVLDLGTDTLSAVALGAEPPSAHVLDRPPVRGRLLDATVARRAFGRIGPLIALCTMIAFLVSFVAAGWLPGEAFPGGDVAAAASGAAFMTVVLGQTANSFCCRSTTRWPGALGWTTNRLLVWTATIELGFSLLVLFVTPIARELGHANPPLAGWLVALVTPLLVLAVDALWKHRIRTSGARQRAPLA